MAARDMVARHSNYDENGGDYVPTPPFATRAFYKYVAPGWQERYHSTAWDPAAGAGHMHRVLKEQHANAMATDITPRHHSVREGDFLTSDYKGVDLILTNPPYKYAEDFFHKGWELTERGLALLVRVQFLEGQGRWQRIFNNPTKRPTQIAFFSDRIPFKVGEVVRKAPKMFFHVFLYWDKQSEFPRPPIWIPPTVQKELERDEDYG